MTQWLLGTQCEIWMILNFSHSSSPFKQTLSFIFSFINIFYSVHLSLFSLNIFVKVTVNLRVAEDLENFENYKIEVHISE